MGHGGRVLPLRGSLLGALDVVGGAFFGTETGAGLDELAVVEVS